MGNEDDGKSAKSEKSSSPLTADQTNHNNHASIHVYPDWAAMQAYYGPRVPLPPYYNSAVASGHAPHPYMWGPPQHMMPPYGAPYAAIYSHGGVYGHPAVPLAATPLAMETPTKSSGNQDRGLMKKLKGFDALAMSIGNSNVGSAEGGAERSISQSSETEGSSNGSDGNTALANQNRRKRSREGTPATVGDGKTDVQPGPVSAKEVNAASDKMFDATVAPAFVPGKLVGPVVSPGMNTMLELKNLPKLNSKASPTNAPQPCGVLPPEAWLHNERELKRERRKQSNRESARRSRLRKQAETEELARKVEGLIAENVALKSDICRVKENSDTLRQENATLMGTLKNAREGRMEGITINLDDKRIQPFSTENLLSSLNNSGSIARDNEKEGDMYEKKSGAKLHQLLDAPRADAVAAG